MLTQCYYLIKDAGKIIVDKLKGLDEFKDIKGLIGKKIKWKELSKTLIDFLSGHVEKAVEDSKSQEILKAVVRL